MKKNLILRTLIAVAVGTVTITSCNPADGDPQQYTVTATGDGNGTATANPATATPGTNVTLTATPADGYRFDKWTVVGGNVRLEDEAANPATFTMPAENVIIKAEFIEAQDAEYTIAVTSDGNGTATANPATAPPGTTVTLTATPADEYRFGKWTVSSGDVQLQNATANPATFTMPAGNVEIRAEFELSDSFNGFDLITDPAFNQYCRQFDTNSDGVLSRQEAERVTAISANELGIRSLAGIEVFTNLVELFCAMNALTELDLSGNLALAALDCLGNYDLHTLNVSENIALEYLECSVCSLSVLNISNNVNLVNFWCDSNDIAVLDVKNNTALEVLSCIENQLSSLDVGNNPALLDLTCSRNKLTSLNVDKNSKLMTLCCNYMDISSLNIGNNLKLKHLEINHTQISGLNLSGHNDIGIISAYSAQLSADALRAIFRALPYREPTYNAIMFAGGNPGSSEISADDESVLAAQANNWRISGIGQ